jgi:hypothetical protein
VEICGLDSSGSGYLPVSGSCEHEYKNLGSINARKYFDQLNDYQVLKDSVPWISLVGWLVG